MKILPKVRPLRVITVHKDSFSFEMFFVVIQLGAIIAVIYMYWSKLWPFRIATRHSVWDDEQDGDDERGRKKLTKQQAQQRALWKNEYRIGSIGISRPIILMWIKVLVATVPAGIIGILHSLDGRNLKLVIEKL